MRIDRWLLGELGRHIADQHGMAGAQHLGHRVAPSGIWRVPHHGLTGRGCHRRIGVGYRRPPQRTAGSDQVDDAKVCQGRHGQPDERPESLVEIK